MDPAMLQAGASLLNAVGGLSKQATPGLAQSGMAPISNKADVDFSGWTVATGGSRADGAKISKTSADSTGTADPSGGFLGGNGSVSPMLVIGLAVAAGLLWRTLNR